MQWQNALIPLGIIVLMSVLGYLTQMLKKTADKRLQEKERERDRERRAARADAPRPASASADIDRYLRAVDAQRQKPAPSPRQAPKSPPPPVPTVPAARKPRLADTAAPAFPEAKRRVPKATPADDLPVATVVKDVPTAPVVTAPAQLAKPLRASAPPPTQATAPATPFALQFAALLKSPNAAALAVALHEVLGPPKCKQG